jgi:glycosyltransferase involved in cell wall biosynthesis
VGSSHHERSSDATNHDSLPLIPILFLCRQLGPGGAENQLLELVKGLDKGLFTPTIVTFYDGGELYRGATEIGGVKVVSLGKRGRWDLPVFAAKLIDICRRERPALIHGYLSVANELALLAGRIVGAKTIWGIRASTVAFKHYDWVHSTAFRAGALLSSFPDRIIVNSKEGRRHHIACGYDAHRMVVIQNGIDTHNFRPDVDARCRQRRAWQVHDNAVLIGIVGRMDPMKDHGTFFEAAALIAQRVPSSRFVCVGKGMDSGNLRLKALAADPRIATKVIWAGFRDDMAEVYSAMDVLVSSSMGEGFSSAIGEAMSCGVLCAVTNVGDSALIVGPTGIVVPPSCPGDLADAVQQIIALGINDRETRSAAARARIEERFGITRLVAETQQVFLELTA